MNYEDYITKCIELAKKGEGYVSPNPLVGAIVLDKEGNVVGEGFHEKYGEHHAEINALNQAGGKAQGGTLFVTLEPCSHFGKTPPCVSRIISEGIKKVIIGMIDPNPSVSGQGIMKLQQTGIETVVGVLEKECQKLNEIFVKNMEKNSPFVSIKTACTLDGKIATHNGSSKWITSNPARQKVQELRNRYDAILTGSGTVLYDDPLLTVRYEGGRNPVRVLIDTEFKITPDFNFYNNDGTKIYVAVRDDVDERKFEKYPPYVEFIKCPMFEKHIGVKFLFDELYKRGICSIFVEGGGTINGMLLKRNLIDKMYLFYAPKILGDPEAKDFVKGFKLDNINQCINLKFDEVTHFPPDILVEAYSV